jgi:hypothetical protein
VGLLAEEFDPVSSRMLGNFPQAYSHVGLINCALNLTRQEGQRRTGGAVRTTRDGALGERWDIERPFATLLGRRAEASFLGPVRF